MELASPSEDRISISEINGRTCLSEVGQHSTVGSKNPSPGELPDSPGASSRVLYPETMPSDLISSELISVEGGGQGEAETMKLKITHVV